MSIVVWEVSGSIPSEVNIKTFADVGNLLTTLVLKRLTKDSGSLLLKTRKKSQEQYNNRSLQKTLSTLEVDLDPFLTGGVYISRMISVAICCKFEK